MTDESRVRDLVERALNDQLTPEEACAHDPQLLDEVRARLDVCRKLDLMLDDVFPSDTPSGAPAAASPVNNGPPPDIPGYDVLGVLGRGGIGIIYRVRHHKLNRVIALKMLLSGEFAGAVEIARFMREARAVAALKHPNIVQVYDVGEVNGRPYFTMELVEGGSLAQRISGAPSLHGPRQAAELVATLARAMHVAHQAGIVHRDLKPGNILLSLDGIPKISDFGLATRFAEECSLTGTDARLGTPSYMSPEQATGARQATPSVDVYALGAILYELLTGEPPFRARTALETQRKVVSDEAIRPSRINAKIHRDLETICLKCLSKHPESRYQSAAELADDLDRFLRLEPITARPASLVERTGKWFRRRTAIAVAAALGVLLLALGVGITLWVESQRVRLNSEIEADLQQVSSMDADGRWSKADEALRRAEARLDIRSSNELRQRVTDARHDLTVAASFDKVRLSRATAGSYPLYQRRADSEYEANFRNCLHVVIGTDTESAAKTVKASPVRAALLAALDDWACTTSDASRRQWVLDVARRSDPDSQAWSERIRDPSKWDEPQAALNIANAVPIAELPVSTLLIVAQRLRHVNRDPQTFLRAVRKDHPADFYANLALGDATIASDSREAEVCYRAALAARPEAAVGYCAVADSLREQHRFDEAMSGYAQALQRHPHYVRAKCGIAATHVAAQSPNDAVAACYDSLKLDPDYAWTHYYLAEAFLELGRLEEATQHYAIIYKDAPDSRGVSDAYRASLIQAGKLKEVREIFWGNALQEPAASYDRCKGYPEFCLFAGNAAEYRASRAAILDRFGSTTSAETMRQIACMCLLSPASQEDSAVQRSACALADRALTYKKPTSGDYANYVFVKALADYRRGDFDAAIKEASGDGSRIMGPCPKLIVAIASKGQGRDADAERALAEASVKFDWRVSSAGSPEFWVYHILLREAQSRIVPELASMISGSRQPINNDQRAILIAACQSARLDRLCTRTFIDALAVEPYFIEVRRLNPRFVAACASSALALCHENENPRDVVGLNTDALRELASQSLSKALHAQVRQPPMSANGRNWLSREFACWQLDPGLADLRDSVRLASGKPEFRSECAALWRLLDHDIVQLRVAKPSTPTTRPTTLRS